MDNANSPTMTNSKNGKAFPPNRITTLIDWTDKNLSEIPKNLDVETNWERSYVKKFNENASILDPHMDGSITTTLDTSPSLDAIPSVKLSYNQIRIVTGIEWMKGAKELYLGSKRSPLLSSDSFLFFRS
jgi:hypothetical protein